jgi:hypothetical protein
LLNPAIPLVSKRDRVHEATFMAHDIGHYYILELIYTGYEDTELQRLVYITYRMISEAVTMVIADMMFIDSLKRSGVQYDFDARKIYPLFKATGFDFEKDNVLTVLYQLCKANVEYCCKGNDSLWSQLCKDSEQALTTFKDKFGPFFIEDYKWNVSNYTNMTRRKEAMRKWWDVVSPLRALAPNVRAWSIDDFITKMSARHSGELKKDQIVDLVFETMWHEVIVPGFTTKPEQVPENTKLYNAFVRYMMGQFALFSTYDSVAETKMYQNTLISLLLRKSAERSITANEIHNAVQFYGAYVDLLQQKNLISMDDALTFKVCMHFSCLTFA